MIIYGIDVEVSESFLFEQELFFAYKSSELISNRDTGLWVVAYSERVVRVCASFIMALYCEHRLCFVLPDMLTFALELGMAMGIALGYRANVRKVLELP